MAGSPWIPERCGQGYERRGCLKGRVAPKIVPTMADTGRRARRGSSAAASWRNHNGTRDCLRRYGNGGAPATVARDCGRGVSLDGVS
ncbi:hypothetical protein CRG98_032433 [Punica granatum]|uniref:Uncharacterized protein n=1 Tax=Punica granatum TaxID=22663 RepID=A0A2I0IT25_PUNGR|nr:hypothetical protein CRG98_032433 [Punica granatum]